jgi:CDP-ribitol ribitolphosphotransferase
MIFLLKLGSYLLNFIYIFFKLLPTKEKVTMISRQSDQPSMEFTMVEAALHRHDPQMEVVLLCHTLDGGVNSTLWTKLRYGLHMFVQMYHIATSQVVILDGYCMVISLLHHKSSLKVVQMWHSMGTMKKFGYAVLDTPEGSRHEVAQAMKMHRNYDYIFASSPAYRQDLAQGFGCPEDKILTMPLPRLDLLRSETYRAETRQRIYAAYPALREKKVILYCPTFRKDETRFGEALEALCRAVPSEEFQLVVKLHPLSKVTPEAGVVQAKEFSSFEMLFVADAIISDYSCIIYEGAELGVPLYFYNFDMELYTHARGLALDYEKELPGVISGDPAVLMEAIRTGDYDLEALHRFADKYIQPTDHATEDIAAFVLGLMGQTVAPAQREAQIR